MLSFCHYSALPLSVKNIVFCALYRFLSYDIDIPIARLKIGKGCYYLFATTKHLGFVVCLLSICNCEHYFRYVNSFSV